MDPTEKLVTLCTGRTQLGVAPGTGGSIAYYRRAHGRLRHDWLRPASAADLASGAAERLACFPLVPYSNRIRDGRFAFRGRTIRLRPTQWSGRHVPHGHGWRLAWSIVERGNDHLAIAYERAADDWPYPYRARQDFALTDDELQVTLSVVNAGPETMPVGLGLHPYFPRTAGCRLIASVAAMWATDAEVMPTGLTAADSRMGTGEGLSVSDSALDNTFTGWQRRATIVWPEHDARLTIDADPPLEFLAVFTPPGEDYFCVEPVSHCTDAFNLAAQGRGDTGMLALRPGAGVSATVRFRPQLG
jgi:aldose 1-epimerase